MRLISVVVSTCSEKVSAFTKARRTLNNEDRGSGARFITELVRDLKAQTV
jgi:hypothetical protein